MRDCRYSIDFTIISELYVHCSAPVPCLSAFSFSKTRLSPSHSRRIRVREKPYLFHYACEATRLDPSGCHWCKLQHRNRRSGYATAVRRYPDEAQLAFRSQQSLMKRSEYQAAVGADDMLEPEATPRGDRSSRRQSPRALRLNSPAALLRGDAQVRDRSLEALGCVCIGGDVRVRHPQSSRGM